MNHNELDQQLIELKETLKSKTKNIKVLKKQIQGIEKAIQTIKETADREAAEKERQNILENFKNNPLIKIIENKFDCKYTIDHQFINCVVKFKRLKLTYDLPIYTTDPYGDQTHMILKYFLRPLINEFIEKTFVNVKFKDFKLCQRGELKINVSDIHYEQHYDQHHENENNIQLELDVTTYTQRLNHITITNDDLYSPINMTGYMQKEYTLESMKAKFQSFIPGNINITENLFDDIETFLLENKNELVKIINTIEYIIST